MDFAKKRQKYLQEHDHEYPFPLNGTDWARLVAAHKYLDHHNECKCDGCDDFFNVVHKSRLREHEQESARRALKYWFWLGRKNGCLQPIYTPEKTSHEKAWELLCRLSSDPEMLAETEKRWLELKATMYKHKQGTAAQGEDACGAKISD